MNSKNPYSKFKKALQQALIHLKNQKNGVFLVYGGSDKLVQLANDSFIRTVKTLANSEITFLEPKDLKDLSPSDLAESHSLFSSFHIAWFAVVHMTLWILLNYTGVPVKLQIRTVVEVYPKSYFQYLFITNKASD